MTGGIDAQIALQVLADQLRVGVGDYAIILVNDENIPLAVNARGRVVIGDGLFAAKRLVVAKRAVD